VIDNGWFRPKRRLPLTAFEAIRPDALGDELDRLALVKGPPLPSLPIMLDAEVVAQRRRSDVKNELDVLARRSCPFRHQGLLGIIGAITNTMMMCPWAPGESQGDG
jgi:hypothetical protein